jgi:acetylornithine deacetylase
VSKGSKQLSGIKEDIERLLQGRSGYVASLLCELIAFRSTVGCEHEAQKFIYEHLKSLGFAPQLAAIDEDVVSDPDYTAIPAHASYRGRPNILVDIPGSGGGRSAILNSHSDVVPAPEGMFAARHEGGIVYGRGACDAKGQIVSLVLALEALKALGLRLKGDLQAQIVIEEEGGGNGSLSVIRQGNKADAAIVLEPTSLRAHPANRGAVWFRLGVNGKSAHMGKYWEGVSAIEEMVGLIGILKEYEAALRKESAGNPLFPHDPSPVTINIGQINGGDWPSTVPEECSVEGGIAFLPNRRIEQIHEEVLALIETRASEWAKKHCHFEFGRLHNEAFETPVDHPAVDAFNRAAASVLGERPLIGWTASCDARLFSQRGGMPTITFGAGELSHAHSLDEQIRVDDILRATEVLVEFLVDWCGIEQEEV